MSAELAIKDALIRAIEGADCGVLVYDHTPQDIQFPFAFIHSTETNDDGSTCSEDSVEVNVILHILTRTLGQAECLMLAGKVKAAIHAQDLPLDIGYSLSALHVTSTRTMTEPDNITSRAVMTIRALIDPA